MSSGIDSDVQPFDSLPPWALALGPVVVLTAVLALLWFTSPFGDVSAMTAASTTDILWTITVVGIFVGVVPVVIGMLWFPFIRRLDPRYLHAVLALSAGVLAFVGVEMAEEAID